MITASIWPEIFLRRYQWHKNWFFTQHGFSRQDLTNRISPTVKRFCWVTLDSSRDVVHPANDATNSRNRFVPLSFLPATLSLCHPLSLPARLPSSLPATLSPCLPACHPPSLPPSLPPYPSIMATIGFKSLYTGSWRWDSIGRHHYRDIKPLNNMMWCDMMCPTWCGSVSHRDYTFRA